jgi:DNA-binding NtrC family response regulator
MPTVIVAEDEPLIRELLVLALADAGFEVVAAPNGEEALKVLEDKGASVAALVSDVNMPGSLDGVALANHVRRRWPRLGIILASGRGIPDMAKLPEGCRFLRKPYATDEMVRNIRNVLAT